MKIQAVMAIFAGALVSVSANCFAQSGSFGGAVPGVSGPEAVEESFFGFSYSSSASACTRAKQDAENAAKKKPNLRATSLGACSCSSTKKKLWLPQAQAQYSMETGNHDYSQPVDAYECTVNAKFSFYR